MSKYMDHTPITVEPRLHAIMKERGITQLKLAEMSGVSQAAISRFDKNDKHVDWHVFAIADALNLDVKDLFIVRKNEKQNTEK